jgi:hypothetical protein
LKLWGLEPAVIISFVVAALTLLVSFGIPIAQEQRDAIVGLVTTSLVIIGGLVTRQQVSPKAKIAAAFGEEAVSEVTSVKMAEIGTPPTSVKVAAMQEVIADAKKAEIKALKREEAAESKK